MATAIDPSRLPLVHPIVAHWQHPDAADLGPSANAVFACLCGLSVGWLWEGRVEDLARLSGVGERTLKVVLPDLEDRGRILRRRTGRGVLIQLVQIEPHAADGAENARSDGDGAKIARAAGAESAPSGGARGLPHWAENARSDDLNGQILHGQSPPNEYKKDIGAMTTSLRDGPADRDLLPVDPPEDWLRALCDSSERLIGRPLGSADFEVIKKAIEHARQAGAPWEAMVEGWQTAIDRFSPSPQRKRIESTSYFKNWWNTAIQRWQRERANGRNANQAAGAAFQGSYYERARQYARQRQAGYDAAD